MQEKWEETQLGQLTPATPRDISDQMTSCSARKAARKKEKGGEIWSDNIYLHILLHVKVRELSWRWTST